MLHVPRDPFPDVLMYFAPIFLLRGIPPWRPLGLLSVGGNRVLQIQLWGLVSSPTVLKYRTADAEHW